jgi:hypothetical protein
MCAFDQDTPGDITHVTAGAGLDGGGEIGAVTLRVDPSYVQVRVTGTCPAGEAVREIDENGNVVCEKDTLDSMMCSDGSVPKRLGANWVCGSDTDSLGSLNCASGQILKRSGNVWTCANDQIFSGTLSCSTAENITSGASAEVSCPAGSIATGGGGDCANDLIITSSPSGNGWRIHCQTSQANIKAWAVCCTLQ